jgi:hypothetical protein
MRLSTETDAVATPSGKRGAFLARWNRKLHYYLGLYLLLFVWLFAFSGLLLNHSSWKFAEFWDSRQQTSLERDIAVPASEGDLAQARDLMRQLEIRGEIEWTRTGQDADRLDFRVSRPGHIFEIQTDLARKKASVRRIDLNAWGVIRLLHNFTGVRLDDSRNSRDWFLTSSWAWTMDAVAVGLILMVLSSLYMWCELRQKRLSGLVALALGVLSSALFCVGLRWFY